MHAGCGWFDTGGLDHRITTSNGLDEAMDFDVVAWLDVGQARVGGAEYGHRSCRRIRIHHDGLAIDNNCAGRTIDLGDDTLCFRHHVYRSGNQIGVMLYFDVLAKLQFGGLGGAVCIHAIGEHGVVVDPDAVNDETAETRNRARHGRETGVRSDRAGCR